MRRHSCGSRVLDGTVGNTAVRSTVYARHDPVQLDPAGIYEYQDQGRLRFRYALLPHAGDWRTAGTVQEAASLNRQPSVILESAHPGTLGPLASFAWAEPRSIALWVMKRAEEGGTDVILRAHETRGRATRAVLRLPLLDRSVPVTFGAHEIKTLRIPIDPGAPAEETDLLERPLGGPVPRPDQ
jgi:alpha-mannosidase